MATPRLYLTWYPMYLCNQTHLIDDIRPYVCMKSHTLHTLHQRHFIWHHIHSCWPHTVICMSWNTLCLWNYMHYIWCLTCCVYDYQDLYLAWNLLKVPSHPLCMSSHPLSQRYHTYCVMHHRWHMNAIKCTIQYIISTLYDNNVWYLWHCMHYIQYITRIIYDNSSTLYDVTFTVCATSHSDSMISNIICSWHIHFIWITHSAMTTKHCVPSQPLGLTFHSKYFWLNTQCTNAMTRSECKSSQPLHVWHHMHYIWHHIYSLWPHTTLFMTSSPLYLTTHPFYVTSHPLYLCNHTHSINDITATQYMISQTVYMWHSTHYIYDIISTMFDNTTLWVVDTTLVICVTSFALEMISHQFYHTKPPYLWCHIHFRNGITTTLSNITPTVSFSSQHLHWYLTHFSLTSYPLYVWHQMHSI